MRRSCCLCGKEIEVASMAMQYGAMDQDGRIVPECEHVDCKAVIHFGCGVKQVLEAANEAQEATRD